MVSQWISGQIFYQGNKTKHLKCIFIGWGTWPASEATTSSHVNAVTRYKALAFYCRFVTAQLCYSLRKYKMLKNAVSMLFILKISSPSRKWERKGIAKPLGITTCLLRNAPAWNMESMMHPWAALCHPVEKMIWSFIRGQVFIDATAHQLTHEKKEPEQNK